MKIDAVDVFLLHRNPPKGYPQVSIRSGPFIFVKLTADDGAVGWGQALQRGGELAAHAVVSLGNWLKEVNSVTIEGVWQQFFRRLKGSNTGPQLVALSAIDIALHDLQGHLLGVPVSTLLGGRVRSRIPVYASFMEAGRGVKGAVDGAAASIERGFTAIKLHSGIAELGTDLPTETVQMVKAVRAEWPNREDLQIVMDVNNTFTAHEAIRVGRQLEELDVWWIEEPVAIGDLDGYHRVQQALDLPVAAGENEFNLWQHRDLVVKGGIDILQPNITVCGGFTGGKKIASLAEAFNRPITCHNVDPSIMTAANMQFASWARTATLCQEYLNPGETHPLRDDTPVLSQSFHPENGYITLNDAPGLGIVVDEERVRSIAEIVS